MHEYDEYVMVARKRDWVPDWLWRLLCPIATIRPLPWLLTYPVVNTATLSRDAADPSAWRVAIVDDNGDESTVYFLGNRAEWLARDYTRGLMRSDKS